MLGGNEGIVGVDGSSEVDGDDVESWGRSSARTTSAGVPREDSSFGLVSEQFVLQILGSRRRRGVVEVAGFIRSGALIVGFSG